MNSLVSEVVNIFPAEIRAHPGWQDLFDVLSSTISGDYNQCIGSKGFPLNWVVGEHIEFLQSCTVVSDEGPFIDSSRIIVFKAKADFGKVTVSSLHPGVFMAPELMELDWSEQLGDEWSKEYDIEGKEFYIYVAVIGNLPWESTDSIIDRPPEYLGGRIVLQSGFGDIIPEGCLSIAERDRVFDENFPGVSIIGVENALDRAGYPALKRVFLIGGYANWQYALFAPFRTKYQIPAVSDSKEEYVVVFDSNIMIQRDALFTPEVTFLGADKGMAVFTGDPNYFSYIKMPQHGGSTFGIVRMGDVVTDGIFYEVYQGVTNVSEEDQQTYKKIIEKSLPPFMEVL